MVPPRGTLNRTFNREVPVTMDRELPRPCRAMTWARRRPGLSPRTRLTAWTVGAVIMLATLPAGAIPPSQEDYAGVPGPSGGDILNVSAVYGPPPGEFWFAGRYASRSDSLESLSCLELSMQYGLHRRATLGIAGTHLKHDRGLGPTGAPVNKQGAGDTHLYLKWVVPTPRHPSLSLGLRPGFRVPTGYDREGDALLPFTTGTLDFELLGLLAYDTPMLGLYVNPGISLPGGKWHNELLAGMGVDLRGGLPFGFRAKGEYLTRYDIAADRFHHEGFGALEHDLPFGLAVDIGYRKRLVHGEDPGAELTLRLTHGRGGRMPVRPMARPLRTSATRIVVPEVAWAEGEDSADPHGIGPQLRGALLRELTRRDGFSASPQERRPDYTAHLEIIAVSEGNDRSLSIPRILATPQAVMEIAARISVYDARGHAVLDRVPMHLDAKRGMGVQLLPARGDEDTWVPSAQTRSALRAKLVERLARETADELARAVDADLQTKAAAARAAEEQIFGGQRRVSQ